MSNEQIKVAAIAKLARIELTKKEEEVLEKDLPAIIDYVAKLQELDTSHVKTREYLTDLQNQFREDKVVENETERQNVINAFPKKTGEALDVPAVFE